MKKVIVACDSFKGTLSSVRVYEIIINRDKEEKITLDNLQDTRLCKDFLIKKEEGK